MIGLDIDGWNRGVATYRMLSAYFNMKYLFPKAKVKVRMTKHGYHVIGYGPCLPFEKSIIVRSTLGDDRRRVHIDEWKWSIGSHNFNVLWTTKGGFNVHEVEPI